MQEKDFERLLKICRISLTEKEAAAIRKDISSILEYFDAIETVKCDSLEPSYHPINVKERLREDIVKPFENPDELLKGTKTHRFYVIGPDI